MSHETVGEGVRVEQREKIPSITIGPAGALAILALFVSSVAGAQAFYRVKQEGYAMCKRAVQNVMNEVSNGESIASRDYAQVTCGQAARELAGE